MSAGYNPNDNQGVRYLLGSEYLCGGETDKARIFLEAEAAHYPPYHYELALLHLQAGNWVPAANALHLGFCTNPYVAEILRGNPDLAPMAIWHGTNLAEPATARDYLTMYGDLWRRRPDFVAVLHWLYTHSCILVERAAFLECSEELRWEHDFHRRGEILARMAATVEGIDDRLSEEIVAKWSDRSFRGCTLS